MTLADLGLRTRRTAGLGVAFVARARKTHPCDLCEYPIPAGDHYRTWTLAPGMWGDGDYWFPAHVHAVCYSVFIHSEWARYDENLPDPWDFRSEILDQVVWTTNDEVEYR